MVKHYCDACGVELTELNARAVIQSADMPFAVQGKLAVRIVTGLVNDRGVITWNDGDFCDSCVVGTIAQPVSAGERPEL